MQQSRFAVHNPNGASALAAELRLEPYQHAHRRLADSLRRWPTPASPRFATTDKTPRSHYSSPKETGPWAR